MAETLVGRLHVIRTRKRPRGHGFAQLLAELLEDTLHETRGRPIPEYPPTYYMHVPGRTVGVERDFGDDRTWRQDNLFRFVFKGQPKLLNREMEGWRITVRGSYERWDQNALGGYMRNYRVLEVTPPGDGDEPCPCQEVS